MVDVSKEMSDMIKKMEEQYPDLGNNAQKTNCWNNEAEVLLLRKPLSDADMTRSEAPESVLLDSGDFDFIDEDIQAVLEFATEELSSQSNSDNSFS